MIFAVEDRRKKSEKYLQELRNLEQRRTDSMKGYCTDPLPLIVTYVGDEHTYSRGSWYSHLAQNPFSASARDLFPRLCNERDS